MSHKIVTNTPEQSVQTTDHGLGLTAAHFVGSVHVSILTFLAHLNAHGELL